MRQMVDPQGTVWDWVNNAWVPTPQGVFAAEAPYEAPSDKPKYRVTVNTPDGLFVGDCNGDWFRLDGAVATPAAKPAVISVFTPQPDPVYMPVDLRDRFVCADCGDTVQLRAIRDGDGVVHYQCFECEDWTPPLVLTING